MNILFLIAMVYSAGVVSARGKPYRYDPKHNVDSDSIEPNNLATPWTTNDYLERQLSSKCKGNEEFITIDITTDWYGFENSWVLYRMNDGTPVKLYAGPPSDSNYDGERRYLGGYCLSPGRYKFVMKDLWKDGMCCNSGQGKYAGYLQGKEIFSSPSGSEDWERRGHDFSVPSSDSGLPFGSKSGVVEMTPREENWLSSHNSRRQTWHEQYGKSYVPLTWSNALADEARAWAEQLAEDCELYHDPNTNHGENIALNYGWDEYSTRRTTENVLSRFVEDEANLSYPDNGHLTQVLWRATRFGCADAVRPYEGGRCHTQVCRYSKPGNCNMSRYQSWLTPMLLDDSVCGNKCPPDGCN